MSIVVTTPTGHIGNVVVEQLLDRGEQITIIARNPDKVAHLAERGAKVLQGSHDDAALLTKATEGAKALFVLTPPDMASTDIRATYERFGRAAAEAIRANSIPYVVHLSSVGADQDADTGPILGLHYNEAILREAATNIVQLRPAYFMENTMMQIPTILQTGQMFTALQGDARFPMVATRDIGVRAAELLVQRDWSGEVVVELQGAADVSYDDVAEVLSEVLGREVTHITVSSEQLKAAISGMGASEQIAEAFAEMTTSAQNGHIHFNEVRSDTNTTPTAYQVFAEEDYKPAIDAAQAG